MTRDTALERLNLNPDATTAEVDRAYEELYNDFQLRIQNAPTPKLRERFEERLSEVEEAYAILRGEAGDDDLPASGPVDAEASRSETVSSETKGQILVRLSADGRVRVDYGEWTPVAAGSGMVLSARPGEHVVDAETEDGRQVEKTVTVEPGRQQILTLSFPPATATEKPEDNEATEGEHATDEHATDEHTTDEHTTDEPEPADPTSDSASSVAPEQDSRTSGSAVAIGVVALLLLVGGAAAYLSGTGDSGNTERDATAQADSLLDVARSLIATGNLTEPDTANALAVLQRVERLDTANTQTLPLRQEIAITYRTRAQQAEKREAWEEARTLYQTMAAVAVEGSPEANMASAGLATVQARIDAPKPEETSTRSTTTRKPARTATTQYRTIFRAAGAGDVDALAAFLEGGTDVNTRRGDGTALHRAAWWGHVEAARFLLDRGANVNSTGNTGLTPLHEAADMGRVDVARLLIERGANVDARDNFYGRTPLLVTPYLDITKLLIESGADVDVQDRKYGNSALHGAGPSHTGDLTLLNLLLEHIDVDVRNNKGRTPLHEAKLNVVARRLLQEGADVNARDEKGNTPLHLAIAGKGLILNGDSEWSIKTVRVLVEAGAAVNARNEDGKTPLSIARERENDRIAAFLVSSGGRE